MTMTLRIFALLYSLAVLGGLLYYCKKKDARVENFCILYTTYVRVSKPSWAVALWRGGGNTAQLP